MTDTRRATLIEMCRRHAPSVKWSEGSPAPGALYPDDNDPTPDGGPTVMGVLQLDTSLVAHLTVSRFIDRRGRMQYAASARIDGAFWRAVHDYRRVENVDGWQSGDSGRVLRRVMAYAIGNARFVVDARDARLAAARAEAPEWEWRASGLNVGAALDTPRGIVNVVFAEAEAYGNGDDRLWMWQRYTPGFSVTFRPADGETVGGAVAFGLDALEAQRVKILREWRMLPDDTSETTS